MLELKKGNQEKLEGRVLMYAENLRWKKNSSCRYPALYALSDPSDLDEEFEEAKRMWEFINKNVKIIDNDRLMKIHAFFCHSVIFNGLENIQNVKGDVLYGGRIYDIGMALPLFDGMIKVYSIHYLSQLEMKINGGNAVDEKEHDSFRNYEGNIDGFKRKFCSIIGRLCDAVKNKDKKNEKNIGMELKEFTKGSSFLSKIAINVIGVASTNLPKKLEILGSYSELAGLVQEEKYNEAIRVKNRLRELFGNNA